MNTLKNILKNTLVVIFLAYCVICFMIGNNILMTYILFGGSRS